MAPRKVTVEQLDRLYVAIDAFLRREPTGQPSTLLAIHRAWTLDAEVGNGFAQYFWNSVKISSRFRTPGTSCGRRCAVASTPELSTLLARAAKKRAP